MPQIHLPISISKSWRLAWLISGLCLLTLALVRCGQQPTTFLSLDPQNEYVGSEACQPCHEKVYASYVETGMGKSLYLPDPGKVIEYFGPEVVVYDSFSNFSYHPFWRGNDMYVREFRLKGVDTVYQREEKVDFIVGSGHQTRSYLMQREDYLYEFPITWYVNKQIWDLSPGYEQGHNSRFDREIGLECLACHTGSFEHVTGSKNRYRKISLGIDCERCHGPGKAHVVATENGQLIDVGEETDYTIVNPAKLPLDKQFDVCQQCHLQGINVLEADKNVRDFRPAMRLPEIYHVFLEQPEDPEAFGIASHAERLQQSQCFIHSEGKLTCTTCHDPHKSIAVTDTQVYIRQCQGCHSANHEKLCGVSESEQMTEGGNCVSCHMPKGGTRDIPHVSFHDHKIRVMRPRAERDLGAEKAFLEKLVSATDSPSADAWSKAWLLYYERQDPDPTYLEKAAKGLSPQSLYQQGRLALYQGRSAEGLEAVEQALLAQPQDPYLLFLKGELLEAQQEFDQAYTAYKQSYEQNPASIEAGMKAGSMLLSARVGDQAALHEAQVLFESLREKKPFDARILTNLGFISLNLRDFRQAEQYFSRALRYNPDSEQALENMVFVQVLKNNRVLGKRYFERLIEVSPQHPSRQELAKRLGI